MTLIDELLPRWDERSRYARPIDASPEAVIAAVREVQQRELPVMRALMGIRGLPSVVTRRTRVLPATDNALDAMLELGFTLLGERERELAVGTVGQFWRPTSRPAAVSDAEAFAAFDEPGQCKAAMDFRALSDGGGTVLTTETRILATDDYARRRFRRYWRLISMGSGLIRHELLAAVARRAEQDSR